MVEPSVAPPSVGRSSVRGFLWTTLAWGGNRLVLLGLTLVLARLLTPADFGLVTAALTVVLILDAALDLGVGAAVVAEQEPGVTRRTRTAFSLNLALSVLIAGVGAAASPLIADLFDADGHAGLFALIFLYPLFRGAGQVSDAVLKRDLRFRRRTVVDACRAVVRVAVSLPLALGVGGAFSIAAGIVASEFVALILLWALVPMRPVIRVERATIRSLLRFGGAVTVIRTLGSLRASFDYIVVGAVLGATALGYYGMAYKLPELGIENVLWIFSTVALSAYARSHLDGHEALVSAALRATRLLALFGLTVGTVLAVVARDAVPVLFSARWSPAVVPMMLISLSLGVMSIGWASGDVFTALGRPGTLVRLDVVASLIMVGALLLAPRYGLVGVACVHLGFQLVYAAARLVLLCVVVSLPARRVLAAIGPAVAVAGLTAAAGFGVRALLPAGALSSLLLLVGVCALTALGVSWWLARASLLQVVRAALPARGSTT